MDIRGPGRDGWWQVEADDGTTFWVQVVFSAARGRVRIVGLYVNDMMRVGQEVLRQLPLRQAEGVMNEHPQFYGATEPVVRRRHDAVLRSLDLVDPPLPKIGEATTVPFALAGLRARIKESADVRRKPDVFYEGAANAYYALVRAGVRGPAEAIAKDAEVPVTTVHRWIREARARGFLTPGDAGKAG